MTWMQRAIIFVAALSPTYLVRFHVLGIPTTIFEILILALAGATCARAMRHAPSYCKKNCEIPRSMMIASALFFFAGCISVFVAPNIYAALGIWRAYIFDAMLFGLIAWLHFESFDEFKYLVIALSVSAAIVALVGVVQKFTGWGIPNPFWRAAATRRVTSIFGYPNAVGLYLELMLPFFVAMTVLIKKYRAWFIGVIITSLFAILFAESSGTIAALAVTAGLFFIAWRRTRWWMVGFGIVCVLVLALSPLRKSFADEFLLQGFSGRLRTQMWKETVVMLKPRWVVGAGLAGYQTRVKPFHVFTWAEIYLYPHNLVLTLWSELGLLGLASFIWIFSLMVVWMVHALQHGFFEQRVWAGSILATLSIIFIHGLVDIPYFKNDFSALFWLLVAMSAFVRYTGRPTHEKK